jgi:hypothetical protein
MENNLTKTGQWYWRQDEISFKSFQQMKKEEKLQHLKYLSTLEKEDLSSNDLIILQIYSPKVIDEKTSNFFSL